MRRILLTLLTAFALMPLLARAQTLVPENRSEITLSFAPVVQKSAPAVVNIYATRLVAGRPSPFADDPFFSDFFRMFDQTRPREQSSLGSGVIVAPNGIVVSNHHVVGNATDIRAVLSDRREYQGRILLSDPVADIAIIQLEDAADLPAIEIGDSDALQVGDLVLAIGNPFGVGQTVSSGIVSALARSGIRRGREAGYFIQTDAPINPGNSGGALVDVAGRLVGVNTSILTRSGGSNGIGFAIPASLVKQYVAQAEAGASRFVRPWSGIDVQTVDMAMAEALGLALPQGVMIAGVQADSPFGEAGLQTGDTILAVDGFPVYAASELDFRLTTQAMGSVVQVRFLRRGKEDEVGVILRRAPEATAPVLLRTNTTFDGLTVTEASPAVIGKMGLPHNAEGVVVIAAEGRSAGLGLRPGDMILSVNGASIETTDDLERAAARQTRSWNLQIRRGNRLIRMRIIR